MICLTIKPEPAELIADGIKRVENRTWGDRLPAGLLSQPIGIHHGGKHGAIIATARVVAIVTPEEAIAMLPDQEEYIHGPLCWILSDAQRIDPIPCKGNIGLWEYKGQGPTQRQRELF